MISPSPLSRTSTIVTIACTLVGTVLAYLSLAAAVKWPPFQDEASSSRVAVYKGESARGQNDCTNVSCAFIGVELTGFPSGTAVRCTFDSSVGSGPFVDLQTKVDAAGHVQAQSTNFFGNPGGWVSATCDGVRGELNPW